MAVVNTFYDFDDYDSPVKTYFDDQFYYDFVAGFEKETDIYVREDSIEQKDSFFRYSPDGDENSFITIENVKEKFKKMNADTQTVMTIRFYKDSKSKSYERQVFALLDVFGNIGGVNEILEIAGGLLVGLFSGKIFLFSILSKMYQVDSKNIFDRNSPANGESQTILITRSKSTSNKIDNDIRIEEIEINKNKQLSQHNFNVQEQEINQKSIAQSDLNNEMVQKTAENMRKRYRYSYSILDIAYNYLMPVKVFFYCKRSFRNLHTRYLLFKKGEDKLSKEFDAVEFARSQRKLKMLMHWLMDKSEKFLTAYQKSNAISLSTESDSNSDDPAYTKIPKMLSNSNIKQKHNVIVNKFFEEYLKEKHTGKDINLLHGVISAKDSI